jgi:hypothetical protein
LMVPDVRNYVCDIFVRRTPPGRVRGGIERYVNNLRHSFRLPGLEVDWHFWDRYPLIRKRSGSLVSESKPVDFCRGPAELADAIGRNRPCRLSAELGWHITELIECLQYPERFGGRHTPASTFPPIHPVPGYADD